MIYFDYMPKAKEIITAIACGMLFALAVTSVKAQPKPMRAVPFVKLDVGSLPTDGGLGADDAPLLQLSAALKHFPNARFFRLNWDFSSFSFGSTSVVLYDRMKQTLRFDYSYGHNAGGNPKDNGESHLLYTGVTETIISRAANAHAKEFNSDDKGYILDLTRFGCVSHVLRSPSPKPRSRH